MAFMHNELYSVSYIRCNTVEARDTFFVVAAFALRNRSVFSDPIFVKMFFHISSVLNEKRKKEFTLRNKQTMY